MTHNPHIEKTWEGRRALIKYFTASFRASSTPKQSYIYTLYPYIIDTEKLEMIELDNVFILSVS